MKARSRAVVETGGVLRELSSQPPLTLRRLADPDRETCALALVGSAAGPLPGDDLRLELELREGAQASLVAAGASIALGGKGTASIVGTDVRLAAGARLTGRTGAVIATAGSSVDIRLRIRLAADAYLCWSELVVLGRSGEPAGAARISWEVERAGWPLLRQVTDLRELARREWPGTIAGARVLASAVRVGPDVKARTIALSRTAAVHALAADAELITVLAADAATAQTELSAQLLTV